MTEQTKPARYNQCLIAAVIITLTIIDIILILNP